MKSISIITTLYKSEIYVDKFTHLCEDALNKIGCNNYEIIFVNDGSPDNALEKAIKLKEQHANIVVIELSRNFGHHYALMAGIETATKDLIFTIDCDMEVSPLYLVDFVKKFNEKLLNQVLYKSEYKDGKLMLDIGGDNEEN